MGEATTKDIRISQLVTWRMCGDPYCGHVVAVDADAVAVAFVERIHPDGNVPHPNPILFVDRQDVLSVHGGIRAAREAVLRAEGRTP